MNDEAKVYIKEAPKTREELEAFATQQEARIHRLREALQILLVQFGEYKDGDGAAKYHAVNIAKEALQQS